MTCVCLEVIRRFYPRAYELIWRNPGFFCNSNRWWKAGMYRSDEKRAVEVVSVVNAVKSISEEGDAGPAIYPLLIAMFPDREGDLRGRPTHGVRENFSSEAEKDRRISHPDYFPTYFRREVSQATFSVAEMRSLLGELQSASSDKERRAVFGQWFKTFEPNSVRRYEFIHKIGNELGSTSIPIEIARSVALAISENSQTLGSDFVVSEMRRAVAAVLQVAQRLANSSEINVVIVECIKID